MRLSTLTAIFQKLVSKNRISLSERNGLNGVAWPRMGMASRPPKGRNDRRKIWSSTTIRSGHRQRSLEESHRGEPSSFAQLRDRRCAGRLCRLDRHGPRSSGGRGGKLVLGGHWCGSRRSLASASMAALPYGIASARTARSQSRSARPRASGRTGMGA